MRTQHTLRLIVFLTLLTPALHAQFVYWSFEAGSPSALGTNFSSSISGIPADFGTGTASGVHAAANTVWAPLGGNGSSYALNVGSWSLGDYFQFQINSLGVAPLDIQWSQTRSTTGPSLFHLSYSTDGLNFTSISSYLVLSNSTSANNSGTGLVTSPWSNLNFQPAYRYTNNLSSLIALQNQPTLYFRLVCDAAGSGGGNARLDDVIIDLAQIPEPRLTFLAVSCLLTCYFARKRR